MLGRMIEATGGEGSHDQLLKLVMDSAILEAVVAH